jgi:hypothetical protein
MSALSRGLRTTAAGRFCCRRGEQRAGCVSCRHGARAHSLQFSADELHHGGQACHEQRAALCPTAAVVHACSIFLFRLCVPTLGANVRELLKRGRLRQAAVLVEVLPPAWCASIMQLVLLMSPLGQARPRARATAASRAHWLGGSTFRGRHPMALDTPRAAAVGRWHNGSQSHAAFRLAANAALTLHGQHHTGTLINRCKCARVRGCTACPGNKCLGHR